MTNTVIPSVEDIVVGVDTHADTHVAAIINAVGRHLGHASFETTDVGYGQLRNRV